MARGTLHPFDSESGAKPATSAPPLGQRIGIATETGGAKHGVAGALVGERDGEGDRHGLPACETRGSDRARTGSQ